VAAMLCLRSSTPADAENHTRHDFLVCETILKFFVRINRNEIDAGLFSATNTDWTSGTTATKSTTMSSKTRETRSNWDVPI
jgi:hypothetical protein